jgi:hypothetical protein
MTGTIITGVTPSELQELITQGVQDQLNKFFNGSSFKSKEQENPHLTRKETAQFFNISLNCLNDWCRKGIVTPYKVGQRTYFKRSELVQVMFNQPKRA